MALDLIWTFQDSHGRIVVGGSHVQALDFMDDGAVFMLYVEGDCDIFEPFNFVPDHARELGEQTASLLPMSMTPGFNPETPGREYESRR